MCIQNMYHVYPCSVIGKLSSWGLMAIDDWNCKYVSKICIMCILGVWWERWVRDGNRWLNMYHVYSRGSDGHEVEFVVFDQLIQFVMACRVRDDSYRTWEINDKKPISCMSHMYRRVSDGHVIQFVMTHTNTRQKTYLMYVTYVS